MCVFVCVWSSRKSNGRKGVDEAKSTMVGQGKEEGRDDGGRGKE